LAERHKASTKCIPLPKSQMNIADFGTFNTNQSSKRETPKFNTDEFKSLNKLHQRM